ncbi:DNA replication helicase Dna2 [Aspergillus luchuensis]|uniref:DNA replication helicase Dna2 n=1 Tax=Aspergillus kawachii TaxID=1069201 RepID=A0A146FJQ7_ASPKA|nr:DNA replication helicase Dna2 [Aspergillus luchuensis]
MSVFEPAERQKLRKTLRAYCDYVQDLELHEFDVHQGKAHNILILPLDDFSDRDEAYELKKLQSDLR